MSDEEEGVYIFSENYSGKERRKFCKVQCVMHPVHEKIFETHKDKLKELEEDGKGRDAVLRTKTDWKVFSLFALVIIGGLVVNYKGIHSLDKSLAASNNKIADSNKKLDDIQHKKLDDIQRQIKTVKEEVKTVKDEVKTVKDEVELVKQEVKTVKRRLGNHMDDTKNGKAEPHGEPHEDYN